LPPPSAQCARFLLHVHNRYPFRDGQQPRVPDWERFIQDLARSICEEQSPKRLLLARSKVYELLTNCIPPEVVIRTLVEKLRSHVDNQIKFEVAQWAAYYEHRMKIGSKAIFHIEAFIAKFMAIYKRYIAQMDAMFQ